MDRSSIRAWRRIQQKRVWRNRIQYYARLGHQIVDPDTHQSLHPRDWKVYKTETPWMNVLKTTSSSCSCWMCRNYSYDRCEVRRETLRILRENGVRG